MAFICHFETVVVATGLLSMMENNCKAFFCPAALPPNAGDINLSIALAEPSETAANDETAVSPTLGQLIWNKQ